LQLGVAKSARPEANTEALQLFVAPLEILPFDDAAAARYGRIRTYLETRGVPIGAMDLLIAAHAVSIPASVVTNNEAELLRVPDLEVENWAR
jgi:tRNA(fMet)-specific endonuclease VapC